MRPINALLTGAVLSLAIAACSRDDPNNFAIDDSNAAMNVETLPADDAADNGATPAVAAPEGPPLKAIPAKFLGRWGMVAADCTSTRGDAKGLMTVAADSILFYESEAKPVALSLVGDRRIDGNYAATGEGQSWTLLQKLTLSADGKTLTRVVDEGDSAPSPGGNRFTYTRCA